MKQYRPAVHHTILVVDVEKFGDPTRTNTDQIAIRDATYKALERAFTKAGIKWDACRTEDRGDGAFILVPSDVPKMLVATKLLTQLTAALRQHNTVCSNRTRIRLRVALHAGEVHYDVHGVTGTAVNRTFRLVEAPALKSALDASSGQLAIIVSDWFYDEVVRHYPAAKPSSYYSVQATVKETDAPAWIRLPGHTAGCVSPRPGETTGAGNDPCEVRPQLALAQLPRDIGNFTRGDSRLTERDAS